MVALLALPEWGGLTVMAAGFLMICITGYISSFPQHRRGVLAQWTDPGMLIEMRLNSGERRVVGVAATLIIAPALGFLSRIVAL